MKQDTYKKMLSKISPKMIRQKKVKKVAVKSKYTEALGGNAKSYY